MGQIMCKWTVDQKWIVFSKMFGLPIFDSPNFIIQSTLRCNSLALTWCGSIYRNGKNVFPPFFRINYAVFAFNLLHIFCPLGFCPACLWWTSIYYILHKYKITALIPSFSPEGALAGNNNNSIPIFTVLRHS